MVVEIARTLRRAVGVGDEDVLLTEEIEALADHVGLQVRRADDLVGHGLLARGVFYFPSEATSLDYRMLLLYVISRHRLYGPEALVIHKVPVRTDQHTYRAMTLAGYLMLGPGFVSPTTTAEAREIARLGNLPEWAIAKFTALIERDRAQRDCWEDPALGRRVRRLAGARGLTIA